MFLKKSDPYLLIVGMTGVKMGDRFLQVGCPHGGRLAAEDAGVLVEVETAPPTRLPMAGDEFDLVVVDDTAGLLGTMRPEDRVASVRELVRVLRPGGRVLVVGAAPRGGLGAVLSRSQSGPPFVASGDAVKALEADGFKSVRTLAER